MRTRTAVVVTVGARSESLGAMKLASWLRRSGYQVTEQNTLHPLLDRFDLYAFSAVFSWRLPELCAMARVARETHGGEVWIGGPAVSFAEANARYVESETGIRPHIGLDQRFDAEPGDFPMVYFSRGCPAYSPACGTCPVPRLEGTKFTFYPNARPARWLLDSNLSALPVWMQERIIKAYRGWRGRVDANSGFEPHSFTGETFERWSSFPLACWRFGYDDLKERDVALAMMRLLRSRGLSGDRVRVYTLIGNEPREACEQRIREVIEHGFHPWPQRLRPLDYLGGPLPTRHDWDEPTLIAFQRFYSIAGLWKGMSPGEFFYQGRYPLRAA